jgi:tungstate transport system ATP-binding protein
MNMRAPVTDLPVVLENVSVKAGATTILGALSLSIQPGAPTVLIGPNGSGKTTLLRLLMGLLPPTSGRISWGGREGAPAHRRAIVFQRPVMLRRRAAANCRLRARSQATRARARRANCWRWSARGSRQRPGRAAVGRRTAAARAGARAGARPAVLFLDEPTASLDPAATKAIEDIVRTIAARGVKVVMSTHDLGEARRARRTIVLLHRGRVVEAARRMFFRHRRSQEAASFLAGDLLSENGGHACTAAA